MALFQFRCQHEAFYNPKNTSPGLDHPCPACATCIGKMSGYLYDPTSCSTCLLWMQDIKDKSPTSRQSWMAWCKWQTTMCRRFRRARNSLYDDRRVFQWATPELQTTWDPELTAGFVSDKRSRSATPGAQGEGETLAIPETPISQELPFNPSSSVVQVISQTHSPMKILPITQDPPVEIFNVPTASIPVDINVTEPQPGTSQTPETVNMQHLAQELAKFLASQHPLPGPSNDSSDEEVSYSSESASDSDSFYVPERLNAGKNIITPEYVPTPLSDPTAQMALPAPTLNTVPSQNMDLQERPPSTHRVQAQPLDLSQFDLEVERPTNLLPSHPAHMAAAAALDRALQTPLVDEGRCRHPKLTLHKSTLAYYITDDIKYVWEKGYPALYRLVNDTNVTILPVDQVRVIVRQEGTLKVYFIEKTESDPHPALRPFIIGGIFPLLRTKKLQRWSKFLWH